MDTPPPDYFIVHEGYTSCNNKLPRNTSTQYKKNNDGTYSIKAGNSTFNFYPFFSNE